MNFIIHVYRYRRLFIRTTVGNHNLIFIVSHKVSFDMNVNFCLVDNSLWSSGNFYLSSWVETEESFPSTYETILRETPSEKYLRSEVTWWVGSLFIFQNNHSYEWSNIPSSLLQWFLNTSLDLDVFWVHEDTFTPGGLTRIKSSGHLVFENEIVNLRSLLQPSISLYLSLIS